MLNIFDVIHAANSRQGHMKAEKTLATLQPMHYSPTFELCTLFCLDCFVCHEKNSNVPPTIGAKKPILSSEFRDRIQVDLIDMRVMRKRDVYGNMQRWIMTVKDHSTVLVYLCALPQKKAIFCCCWIGEIFWLHWLSRNLSHWCVYHCLHVKPISLCFSFLWLYCLFLCIAVQFRQWEEVHRNSCCWPPEGK